MPANTGIWSIDAFLNLSGYLLRLLHGCCTPLCEVSLRILLTVSSVSAFLSS